MPDEDVLQVRVVATRYGNRAGVDTLPDDGAWASLSLSGLRDEAGVTAIARFVATLIAGAAVGAGPLIWVHLRSRRMARLDDPAVPQWR